MRRYEAVRETQFKANSHLQVMTGQLKREVKTSQSARRRQELYTEHIETARLQHQDSVLRGIETLSRTQLQRQDRHSQYVSQLQQLHTDFRQIQQNRDEIKQRKRRLETLKMQFGELERVIEGKGQKGSLVSRVIWAYKEVGSQQLSLSTKFQELSTDHDFKKKQCEEIRFELEQLRRFSELPPTSHFGSTNLLRAAVEDNPASSLLEKAAKHMESLAFGLYLRYSSVVGGVMRKVLAVCKDQDFVTRLRSVVLSIGEIKTPEYVRDAGEETARQKHVAKTFSTEPDIPTRSQFAYALTIEEIRRAIIHSHPTVPGLAMSLAEMLRDTPAVSFFLSISLLEMHFRRVNTKDLESTCGELIVLGYGEMNSRVKRVSEALPLLEIIQKQVKSTDLTHINPTPDHGNSDLQRAKIRQLSVEPVEEPRFASADISFKAESDADEAEYLESARRTAKESLQRPVELPRSLSQPQNSMKQRTKKQGIVVRLAALEEKLKALRDTEKTALGLLRSQKNSARTKKGEGSQGSFRSWSSTGSFDSRPGTSLPQARPSLPRPGTSKGL